MARRTTPATKTPKTAPVTRRPVRDEEPTENVCRHGARPVDERCEKCHRHERGDEE